MRNPASGTPTIPAATEQIIMTTKELTVVPATLIPKIIRLTTKVTKLSMIPVRNKTKNL